MFEFNLGPTEEVLKKSNEFWRQEYEKRVAEDQKEGRLEILNEEDRRKHPRLGLEEDRRVWLHADSKPVPIDNISAQGIAFLSTSRVFPGDKVLLSVAKSLSIEAIVLDCEMEAVDSIFMEYQYRIRSRYADEENGYKIYVLARDIYMNNLDGELEGNMLVI